MLSFDKGRSKTESEILLSLIKGSESVVVTPLVFKGVQVGLRYTFSKGIILDEWSPSHDKVKNGIRVRYIKKKNGLVSKDERRSKEFFIDVTCMQNVLRLMQSNMKVMFKE